MHLQVHTTVTKLQKSLQTTNIKYNEAFRCWGGGGGMQN
jgi:hypothetical protein